MPHELEFLNLSKFYLPLVQFFIQNDFTVPRELGFFFEFIKFSVF